MSKDASLLVFSIYEAMSRKCSTFYNRLPNLLVTINWIRTEISFALLKSYLLCLHGTRSLNRNIKTVGDNAQFSCEVSKIP